MGKLEVHGVNKAFQGKGKSRLVVVSDVSLTVDQGEFVSIIGPSGCGKSTLLDMVAGLTAPDEGNILFDGRSIVGKKGMVSYMPQKDVLFPWRTILENVIVPMEIQGVKKIAAKEEALSYFPLFGLEKFAESYPHVLSGGMRQRASFLRTFLCKKELMLLDEPFGKLDAMTRMHIQQWLLKMWQTFKHSILFVTHDVDEAILLSDRVYVMSPRPGRILAEVKIPLPRPRQPKLTTDPSFSLIKTELLQILEEGVFSKTID
ncbi:ABC transporter ATP-binding protein [Microaerobacter geothermalis]|uniref:ABC transporter ATP-binding protein n=1 Tax=Microaerobacter geothermalis TaxID=674972 RepID=UPI001F277D94|nr:ABC transporter ATP-binding protein [Microaerobacter geothermalis]MCF6094241.1 ABC transporter ATP-binding protein [Microaerobacter geothermalis]